MHKRITLFLFMVLNLNIYSQVVIKDEIVLDEVMQDAVNSGVETPEYGQVRVWYVVNPGWLFVNVTLQVGANSEMIRGPWNCPCNSQNPCYSIGEYEYRYYNNIPAGSTVSIQVSKCVNGTWTSVPVTYDSWIQHPTYYQLNYTVNYGGVNKESSRNGDNELLYENMIRVYPQEPPSNCPQANGNYCENEEPSIPRIILDGIPSNYDPNLTNSNPCQDPNYPYWISYFIPAEKNISDFTIEEYCFNLQRQTWQFRMNNSEIIKIKNIIDYCPNHLPPDTYFKEIFDDLPHWYKCSKISTYEAKQMKEYGHYPQYILKPIVREHEMRHYAQADSIIRSSDMKDYFQDLYEDNVDYECEEFANNYNDALRVRNEIYSNVVYEFQKEFAKRWNKLNPDSQEQYLQNQIGYLIDNYISLLKSYRLTNCN